MDSSGFWQVQWQAIEINVHVPDQAENFSHFF
jgi:hypothetical protein